MLSILSFVFGGLFRMAPEILKWLDRKDERKHEISMFNLQLEADKQKAQSALAQAHVAADQAIATAELQALIAATQAQATETGIKWVDAINSLMRPIITFWWVIVLETAFLYAGFHAAMVTTDSITQSILMIWGDAEKAIVTSIIGFWFVDRSLRKGWQK